MCLNENNWNYRVWNRIQETSWNVESNWSKQKTRWIEETQVDIIIMMKSVDFRCKREFLLFEEISVVFRDNKKITIWCETNVICHVLFPFLQLLSQLNAYTVNE